MSTIALPVLCTGELIKGVIYTCTQKVDITILDFFLFYGQTEFLSDSFPAPTQTQICPDNQTQICPDNQTATKNLPLQQSPK